MFFKTIAFLLPFLKEMFLGEKTIPEAVKTNKMRLLVIAIILGSIALNFFALPRLITISYEHVELKRKHKILEDKLAGLKPAPNSALGPVAQTPTPAPQPDTFRPPYVYTEEHGPPAATDESYRRTKELFDRIRDQESRNHR